MADTKPGDDPGDRGRLTIRHRAVERITEVAARNAPGVQRHGSGLGRLAGRDLPRVAVDVAGDHVRADVELAIEWGRPLAATAAAVQRLIAEALTDHSGLIVDGVRVHVASVIAPPTRQHRSVS